jgi:predicted ester cyclase
MCSYQLKGIVRAGIEAAFNRGDLGGLDKVYSLSVVCHRSPLEDIQGLEDLKHFISDIRIAFSRVEFSLDEITLEGEVLAGRWTFRGTHTGRSPTMPVPPTGKAVTVTGCCMAYWVGGRIVEEWTCTDWLGLFQQLGVIPPMG